MRAGIALGSNVGHRLAHLRQAAACLSRLTSAPGNMLFSRIYATEPVDMPPDSEPFLNAVIEIETAASAPGLLQELRFIEEQMGRPRARSKNVSRTIDLDLLYHGETHLVTGPLILPHPRLHLRAFVLRPLCDIRPGLIAPGFDRTVERLAAALPPGDGVSATDLTWA